VAKKYLEQVDINDSEKEACVDIVKYFHTSTQKLSEKFYSKLQRYNYVTPTSYLQAISGFKMLITRKQNEIMAAKKRYIKGLDQLAFAETQVKENFIKNNKKLWIFRLEKCVLNWKHYSHNYKKVLNKPVLC
jgi:dynein heavy chain